LALLSAFGLRVCSSNDAPPPAASPPTTVAVAPGSAAVAVAAPAHAARHGGSVVVTGGYGVEVLPHADGQVVAYVADPQGGVPAPASVSVTVNVKGADAEVHPVVLVWDSADMRYEGRLVGVAPAPGPVEVVLVAEGRPLTGRVEVVPVLAAVDVHVGAPRAVVVGAPRSGVVVVDRPATGVIVEGPSAGVVVTGPRAVVQAPSLDVRIGGGLVVGGGVVVGGARGRTVIVDDRPGNVILVGRPHDNGRHRGHVRVRGRGRGHD